MSGGLSVIDNGEKYLVTGIVIADPDTGEEAKVEGNALKTVSVLSERESTHFAKIECLLDEMIRQMRIFNVHLEAITGLENVEEEPGDHPIV